MKNYLYIFIITFAVCVLFQSTEVKSAWDSTAAKFMPLQIGNTWVYYTYNQAFPMHGTGYSKYKVTGIFESNGKKYYQIQQTYYHISGVPPGCGITFLNNLRIDSVTMNLYQMGGGCNNGDRLIDSLYSKKNDTSWICRPNQFSHCTDTNIINRFNTSLYIKKFNNSGSGNLTIYAKGIGIINWGFAELNTQCNDTLKGCVINGILYGDTGTIVGINQLGTEIPEEFELSQNYPNPFNPVTHFGFRIAELGLVKLTVYEALGKEVAIIVNRQLQPGTYEAVWDASAYPSGVYYYKLESGSFAETKKMVLVK